MVWQPDSPVPPFLLERFNELLELLGGEVRREEVEEAVEVAVVAEVIEELPPSEPETPAFSEGIIWMHVLYMYLYMYEYVLYWAVSIIVQ